MDSLRGHMKPTDSYQRQTEAANTKQRDQDITLNPQQCK